MIYNLKSNNKDVIANYLGLEDVKVLDKIKYKRAVKKAKQLKLEYCLKGDFNIYFKDNKKVLTINDITLFKKI